MGYVYVHKPNKIIIIIKIKYCVTVISVMSMSAHCSYNDFDTVLYNVVPLHVP